MTVTTDVTTDVTKNGKKANVSAAGAKAGTAGTVSGRFTVKGLPVLDTAEAAKPLYAVVGVADLAIEQARDVPARVRSLPTTVETRVSTAADKAGGLYSQLTVRGRRLVTSIRRQPATQAAVAEGKQAVREASAAATAARTAAKAGEKAAEGAADKIG